MRFFLVISIFFMMPLCAEGEKVIVSIAPTRYLVERIAGREVECLLFVPPGTSPHSYEPSMRQIIDAEEAKIWFRIGEGFENRVLKIFKTMEIVDLRKNLPLLPSRCHCHADAIDTHIWLTPQMLMTQSREIAKRLSHFYPEKASLFQSNLERLLTELNSLEIQLKEICHGKKNRFFLVSHPAFGYFCKEFGFEELSIEVEGKEPSIQQIISLMALAKEKKVNKVIIQPQYSIKGAMYLAKELNAQVISIDPYEGNVIQNLKDIAQVLSQ